MGNITTGIRRNESFTVFNEAVGNQTSAIFALFGKPIEPHRITVMCQFGSDIAKVDVYLGILGPAPVQTLPNQNSATMQAPIIWSPSCGTATSTDNSNLITPIVPSQPGQPLNQMVAQFMKVVISNYAGGSPPNGINVSALIS